MEHGLIEKKCLLKKDSRLGEILKNFASGEMFKGTYKSVRDIINKSESSLSPVKSKSIYFQYLSMSHHTGLLVRGTLSWLYGCNVVP